jgi:ABC-type sulfate transport system permease subunit
MRRRYDWNSRAKALQKAEDARSERVRAALLTGAFVVLALLIMWPLAHVVFETIKVPPSLGAPASP